MRLPPGARARCNDAGVDFREAVHAAAHAMLNILPLYMVCNSTDVGTECDNPYDTVSGERTLSQSKTLLTGDAHLLARLGTLYPHCGASVPTNT